MDEQDQPTQRAKEIQRRLTVAVHALGFKNLREFAAANGIAQGTMYGLARCTYPQAKTTALLQAAGIDVDWIYASASETKMPLPMPGADRVRSLALQLSHLGEAEWKLLVDELKKYGCDGFGRIRINMG